jgi:hypothetical protein
MPEIHAREVGVLVPLGDKAPFTFFEGINFQLRDKGSSAGDNTVRQRLGELTNDIRGRGGFFIAHAKEYLRCFQPVKGVQFTNTTEVPTLLNQLKPTLDGLGETQQREVLEYLVHDATKSIVEKRQPRSMRSGRLDITDATRNEASSLLGKLEDVIMERLEPTPVAGETQVDRFIKLPVRVSEAAGLIYLGLKLGACTPIAPTITPDITPAGIIQTVPAISTPSPTEFSPTPTDIYHLGSGGPINQEKLQQMESQDPSVQKQLTWLKAWRDWYGSADPSQRPMFSDAAYNDIVFYQWTGSDGSIHYKAAWKFDTAGYPGYILLPPSTNWEKLNPPVTASAGHDIGPGQGPVKISTACVEGSDLAKMGVPVGAQLAVEQGTGDWVMVYQDQVASRVDTAGVWEGILGGTKVAYLESSELLHQPFPETLQQYLVPSSPEQWKTASEYQVSDGTTVLWDARVILQRSDGKMFVLLPALIRGEVTIANPDKFAGGTITYVVYEFPAKGGSNFVIQSFRDGKLSTATNHAVVPLKGPIPVSWLQSSAGSPIPLTEFDATVSFTGDVTEKKYADSLAAHQGKMVLLFFPIGGNYVDFLNKIINGQMMGNGKISGGIDAIGMIEPAATP